MREAIMSLIDAERQYVARLDLQDLRQHISHMRVYLDHPQLWKSAASKAAIARQELRLRKLRCQQLRRNSVGG